MISFNFNYLDIILFSGLFICFLLQIIYYSVYFSKPLRYKNSFIRGEIELPDAKPSVSVIICAKNESQNLLRFLPSVLNQNYPQYEVIVVNDGSTDESAEVLGEFEKTYKHLYRTYIPEHSKNVSRKKLAISIGIKAAKYDTLLFTEANCEPLSENWITSMVRNLDKKKQIVIGFSPFRKGSGFFFKLAAFDNLITGLQYISLALFKRPYMGFNSNLAYKKELFYTSKGFSRHLNLRTGEDDLFVNYVATNTNTAVEISDESLTVIDIDALSIWKEMKICQATTQRYYKRGPVELWRFEQLLRYLFLGFLVASVIYGFNDLILPIIAFSFFIIRLIVQLVVINKSAKQLHVGRFYFTLPIFDLLQPLFNIYFYVYRIFRGKHDYTWK